MTLARPLRVRWLAWGDETGGVATALLSNAALLRQRGHAVGLLHFEDGELSQEAARRGLATERIAHDAGSHAHYLAPGFSLRGLLRRLAVMRRLRPALRQALATEPPDLLCTPWPDWLPLLGAVCREQGVGVVLEMPNTPSRYPFDLNQRAYAWAVRRWRVLLLANSQYSARHLARVPGVEVLPPGLDAARFDPSRVVAISRAELGVPEDAILLGLVARLDPSKGADLLLTALAGLPAEAQRPPLHLLLVGGPLDSGYAQQLRSQVEHLGLSGRVHWAGAVPDPERYWPACDLAVNARRDAEPFGLSIIEAILMGKPVLAHALGAPADTVREGGTGWLYHRPDAAALGAALQRALAARAQWPAMGARARAETLAEYAADAVAERYEQLLRRHALARRAA